MVALDADDVELKGVTAVMAAMSQAGEVPEAATAVAIRATALDLPFEDGTFDRIIAAEVLEHIPDEQLAMGAGPCPAPGGTHGSHRSPLRSRVHELGAVQRVPRRPRVGTCGSTAEASSPSASPGRDSAWTAYHHTHGLHSPYWWLKCIVGVSNDQHRLVKAYHSVLVHDIMHRSPWTQIPERALAPLMGKSLVVYAEHAS